MPVPQGMDQVISPAALELGLGGSLRQQLLDQEEERKKKLLREAQAQRAAQGALGPATQMLFSGSGGYSV